MCNYGFKQFWNERDFCRTFENVVFYVLLNRVRESVENTCTMSNEISLRYLTFV